MKEKIKLKVIMLSKELKGKKYIVVDCKRFNDNIFTLVVKEDKKRLRPAELYYASAVPYREEIYCALPEGYSYFVARRGNPSPLLAVIFEKEADIKLSQGGLILLNPTQEAFPIFWGTKLVWDKKNREITLWRSYRL